MIWYAGEREYKALKTFASLVPLLARYRKA